MKKWILATTCVGLAVSTVQSQIERAVQGITLPDLIGSIAEKGEIPAVDYSQIARGTLQIAKLSEGAGQRLPDSVVNDALDAVEAGRELDPEFTEWGKLEEDLQKLLEPPPDQQQQQQGQEGEEGDQNQQQNQEQSSDSQQGDSSQENSDSGSEQQNQDQQGSSESEQNSPGGQQDSENQQQSGNSQKPSDQQSSEGEAQQTPPAKDGAQMGDLQDQQSQEIELADDPQQAPPEQMQTLGGQQSNGEPINPERAALMQMLDQLKQQDDPGKLFKILQEAQSRGEENSQPNTKDW